MLAVQQERDFGAGKIGERALYNGKGGGIGMKHTIIKIDKWICSKLDHLTGTMKMVIIIGAYILTRIIVQIIHSLRSRENGFENL